jgi:hypothetical protein
MQSIRPEPLQTELQFMDGLAQRAGGLRPVSPAPEKARQSPAINRLRIRQSQ